jgi:hypothetical protein
VKVGAHCLVMLGPAGDSRPEQWMAEAKLAAAEDLCQRLSTLDEVAALEAVVSTRLQADRLRPFAGHVELASGSDFHFGRRLAAWCASAGGGPTAYFGGAAAPLLSAEALSALLKGALAGTSGEAWVNNLHSSDWCIFTATPAALASIKDQSKDNGLGWGLATAAGVHVHAMPSTAASRADIDTPIDPHLLQGHPAVGEHLKRFISASGDPGLRIRVGQLLSLLGSEGASLAIIGRSSSSVWAELERRTRIWIRLYVEERGMVASGRVARGEVRSLISDLLKQLGPERFVDRLGQMADGVLWDNRVWMAAVGRWPSARDRYAADLGWLHDVKSEGLRRLSQAVKASTMPILVGGHGLVSGGVLALLEQLPEVPG